MDGSIINKMFDLKKQWEAGARGGKINLMWRKNLFQKEPYIALCHESDGGNNCGLSALQCGGRSPKRLSIIFVILLGCSSRIHGMWQLSFLKNYLDKKTEKNGAIHFTDNEVNEKLQAVIVESGLPNMHSS